MRIRLRCTSYSCSITNAVVMGLEWHSGKLVLLWSLCWVLLCCFLCSLTAFLCWVFCLYESMFSCPFHYLFPESTTELFVRSTPTAIWWVCQCQQTLSNILVHIKVAEELIAKGQAKTLSTKLFIWTPFSWGLRQIKPLEMSSNNSVAFLLRLKSCQILKDVIPKKICKMLILERTSIFH